MKKSIVVLLIFIGLFGVFDLYAGGGWINQKTSGYFKLAQNVIRAPQFFNSDGNVTDIPTVSLYTTSLYAEYGITNNITGILYAPFFVRTTLNKTEFNQSGNTISGDALNSFGDTNIGLKYGFFQNSSIVMAASLILGLPLGSSEVTSERILQTGDGEFNQLIKLEASHSVKDSPLYATLVIGFNNRTKGFSDEFHWGGELGAVWNKFIAIVKIYSVESLYNGDAGSNGSNGVFANNTEYFSFTPELVYLINENWGISGAGGFAFSGRQILAAPNWSLGVFLTI